MYLYNVFTPYVTFPGVPCNCPIDADDLTKLSGSMTLAMLGNLLCLCGPVFANLCAQMYICVAD